MPRKQPDGNKGKGIARRRDSGGERLRISTSLDFEDAQFVGQVSGSSDSEKLARIVKAARLAGLKIDGDQSSSGMVHEFVEWLSSKRSQSARDLHKLLTDFLSDRQ
jgi:hypothetical protein